LNSELSITPKLKASKRGAGYRYKSNAKNSPVKIPSPNQTVATDEEFWKHLVLNIHESIFIISNHY
jgi:hypothetical protein